MKLVFICVLIALTSHTGTGQDTTSIVVRGRVADATTNKGIKASIRYHSMPTGSINGKFTDSLFSFTIYGTARYVVTAEARGYNTKTIIVDPKDVNDEQKLRCDLMLMPAGETIRLNHLIFPQGESAIDPASFEELDALVHMMQENKKMVIQLEGHTDNVGSASANLKLSQERVQAVKEYLVKKGVARKRVKTKAFGGTRPLRNEMTPEARVHNRRVEMRILKH